MSTVSAEELVLLRSTARDVFARGATRKQLGDLGLLGLLTAQSRGGSGWCVVEACAVATEAGRALTPLALPGALVSAAALAETLGHEELLGRLLDGAATGAFVERPVAARATGGWQVTGRLLLPGAARPDVLVIASKDAPLVAVLPDSAGMQANEVDDPVDSSRSAVLVTADTVGAETIDAADATALADAAVLLTCADTLGALAVTAERVTHYLGQRVAFGKPLAAFQALQHRLVDLSILVAETEALVDSAARALAEHEPHAHKLVELTHAFMARHCTTALDDCIQLSGGIGVTWEWPVHHALRRSLVNASVRVAQPLSAGQLREALFGERPGLPGTESHREYVRSVIAAGDPPHLREGHRAPSAPEDEAVLRGWYRRLFETGLLGAYWPPEWGGRPDHEPLHQLVVTEELIRARAPRPVDQVMLASHVLLHFGTPEQKQRYLPRIRTSEDIWCQLFSEPDAGSDLAGVRTVATQNDDGSWVLNGQKTWTTDGHWAQLGLALARTSVEDSRHAGLTVFAVPMNAPGVDVRPIRLMSDAWDTNEVFLTDVVVGADQVIGEIGKGWAVSMSGLEVERFGVGGNVVLLEYLLRDVLELAETVTWDGVPLIDSPAVRVEITRLTAQAEAARAFVTGHVERILAGREGEAEGPIAKVVYTEAYNEIARYGMELASTYGPVPQDAAVVAGRLRDYWFWSRVLTISGGSSEVMRNIIAKRRLRLPSERSGAVRRVERPPAPESVDRR